MDTQNKVNLLDCISEITNRPICMDGENYLYLDGFSEVENSVIVEATKLKVTKEIEATRNAMEQAIQSHIDSVAKSRGYDNISSIGKYLGYDNPFRAECEKLGLFNSSCWIKAYEIQSDVEAGTIPMPTVDEVIEMLPKYE